MKNQIYVVSGGPGTGKSSVLNELSNRGYEVLPEAARRVSEEKFGKKPISQINPEEFQREIFSLQRSFLEDLENSEEEKIVFSDRGFGDTLAYSELKNVDFPEEDKKYVEAFDYEGIFVMDFLDFYEKDSLRDESKEEQKKIHDKIISVYERLGYQVVIVPFRSVKERADYIINKIKTFKKERK